MSRSHRNESNRAARSVVITPAVLRRRLALRQPAKDGDKEERGCVLVVGGAPEMPGAVILAATAALRAGAGKLQIATVKSVAALVAAQVPEAYVLALPETSTGAVAARAAGMVIERARGARAILIGPGMVDERAVARLMKRVVPRLEGATLVVDAAAFSCLAGEPALLHGLEGEVVVTPHAGEMAGFTGVDRSLIERDPRAVAEEMARLLRAVVALKGQETFIAAPGGEVYCNRAGNVGLATSGSGDTLAGIIAGLAARGASPLRAAAWGVHLHALAGDVLARRMGRLGFLAREIPAEIPRLMAKLGGC